MKTYRELAERELNQMHKVRNLAGKKGLEGAAHSQGIDLGKPVRDSHHVDYPDAKFRRTGKPARTSDGKAIGGSASKDKIDNSTHASKLRDAVIASGRVDKRPEAKAKRKKEAVENKARKQKNRDPFTREHTEWWVDMFRLDEGKQAKDRAMRQAQRAGDAAFKKAETKIDQIDKQEKFAQARKPKVNKPEMSTAMDRQRKAAANMENQKREKAAQASTKQLSLSSVDRANKGLVTQPKPPSVPKPAQPPKPDSAVKPVQPPKPQSRETTSKQMQQLAHKRSGASGRVKQKLGGDMFVRDKKDDTDATKSAKKTIRKKARADAVDKTLSTAGTTFNRFKSAQAKGVAKSDTSDSQADSTYQGSGEKSWAK